MFISPRSSVEASGCKLWCKVQSFCVKLIMYVWSVAGTTERPRGCEISFNHSYLHGNGFWLVEKATRLYHGCAHWKKKEKKILFILIPSFFPNNHNNHNKARGSSEREFDQQGTGMQRWGYQNRMQYQTVFIWSRGNVIPRGAHPETLSTRFEVSWMKNNMCIHALAHSNVVQNSQTRHHFKSLDVVSPHFKHKHHKNILLEPRLRRLKPAAPRLMLPVKQVKRYAEPKNAREYQQLWLAGFHYSVIITSLWPS